MSVRKLIGDVAYNATSESSFTLKYGKTLNNEQRRVHQEYLGNLKLLSSGVPLTVKQKKAKAKAKRAKKARRLMNA